MLKQFIKFKRWVGLAMLVLGGGAGLLSGCVDPYTPDAISAPQAYLVVEGSINLSGVTTIRLSRTRNLSVGTASPSPAEPGASVAILDEAGARYPLTEQAAGTYTSEALTLSPSHRYQLRLRTSRGREYASDLVTAKLTPAIDSVSWATQPSGVQIYVNSHDAANDTRYYRWSYEETWEFHSAYVSGLEYLGMGRVRLRQDNIYRCWRTEASTSISLSTTDKLGQDVVSNFPLTLLPRTSNKLFFIYSILVHQYALTAEEYAYWEKLRKNTENLGTLFDPLPSQVSGNVHGLTDASELVLGYVGAGSVTEKRRIITTYQLPYDFIQSVSDYASCTSTRAAKDNALSMDSLFSDTGLGYLVLYKDGGRYVGAPAGCVDCRYRGTNVRPSYWPQ